MPVAGSYSIHHDVDIDCSPAQLYDAVSLPEHLVHWWPLRCTGVRALGEEYSLFFSEEYNWRAEVSKIESNKVFELRMTKSDPDWDTTSFSYSIAPHDQGAMLSFIHNGWPHLNHHFKRSSYCWALLLKGLKDYVERGIIIPFSERP